MAEAFERFFSRYAWMSYGIALGHIYADQAQDWVHAVDWVLIGVVSICLSRIVRKVWMVARESQE